MDTKINFTEAKQFEDQQYDERAHLSLHRKLHNSSGYVISIEQVSKFYIGN